jgi:formamidopyrimidine-DNA glycosylase
MLGRIEIVSSLEDFVESNRLGPDAMAISRSDFFSVISRSKSAIKSALMNQNLIAGIGNIYADEILFQSGVHPTVKALCLDDENYRELYMNMHKVLKRAVERKADPNKMPDNYLLPHRYKDGKCPRCKGEFKTEKVGGRTAYYCPNCQKKKK